MPEHHDNTSNTTRNGAVQLADGLSTPPEGGSAGEQENGSQSPDPNKGLAEARDRYLAERDSAREELAAASARVERMLRAEIERLAGKHLSMGADLFINGNEVSDYLTEDGDVDPERVAADVAAVIAERPGLRKTGAFFDPTQGHGGQPQTKREPQAVDMFRPAPGNNGPRLIHYG